MCIRPFTRLVVARESRYSEFTSEMRDTCGFLHPLVADDK